ncbi:MAG: Trk system potassium transporter TrkA [Muribaculaceae bacterium]|nr:Trk system potassium transporter TrkA [Muribaculaceae bacterium]MDE6331692.1 Trk system potassium transporter TrkA [Muribaculaceae bacterium]
MKIVIAGAGEVGSHLAKLLSTEDQDITLIDRDADKLQTLDANYNLLTIAGNPTSFSTLREANVGSCDLFIAVTPYETDNAVACAMARSFGAKRTVARIDSYDYMDPRNRDFVNRIGVDRVIYPEFLAAAEIITALKHSWARNWFELHDGEIILVGVRLGANARFCGMQLKDLATLSHHFHISAIRRNHETIIPGGFDTMQEDDILYITTKREHIDELLVLTGKTNHKIKRVLVMGGSKIAVRLANMMDDRFRLTIIDNNLERCHKLPQLCPDCSIIHGDGRDVETLADAGIDEMDAFIALTASSETNILACLTAKEMGIKKTVAEVENIQFISQAEGLNIGTTINKKLLASSTIFQLMIDSDASNARCLALTDAEVAELEVREGSRLTKAPVKDLRLPRDITLGGLIRDGKGMLISGMTRIQPGDHVLTFCLAGAIRKVERLFS